MKNEYRAPGIVGSGTSPVNWRQTPTTTLIVLLKQIIFIINSLSY